MTTSEDAAQALGPYVFHAVISLLLRNRSMDITSEASIGSIASFGKSGYMTQMEMLWSFRKRQSGLFGTCMNDKFIQCFEAVISCETFPFGAT